MKSAVRMVLGAGLLCYVFASGMIQWQSLVSALSNPTDFALVQLSMVATVLLQSLRWYLMNVSQKNNIPYRRLFEISLIGHFFAVFAPSSLGLDIIRGWYSVGESPGRAGSSVVTIIMERALGLWALFFSASFGGLWLVQSGDARSEIHALTWFTTSVALGGVVVVVIGRGWGRRAILALTKLPVLGRYDVWAQLIESFAQFAESPKSLFLGLGVSFFAMAATISPFIYLGQRMGLEMSLVQYFFVVPLGMMAMAIPLTPFGVGLGQVAFFQLASWLGASAEQSSTLVTVLQAHSLVFCLLCGLAYLKAGHRVRSAESRTS